MSDDNEKNPNPDDLLAESQTKYKKLDNSGIEGVLFQIDLVTVFMLNALEKSFSWRLSTENKVGAKFDDIIFETSNEAILLQAKQFKKSNRKITYENLLSVNSKNDNFSLAKYFFSYHGVKNHFKTIKNVIICTNADIEIDEKKSQPRCLTTDDILYFERTGNICHTFHDTTVTDLEESIRLYYEKNSQRRNVSKDVISKENIKDFLNHLHFIVKYPSGDNLKTIIEKKISRSKFGKNLNCKTASTYIFNEMLTWYKKGNGIYLNPTISNSIFAKMISHRYCEALDKHEIFFHNNSFITESTKKIIHIVAGTEDLLHVMKVYRAVQREETLFVPPDAEDHIQCQIIEAFEIPSYKYLVLVRHRQVTQSDDQVYSKIETSLEPNRWKKVILVAKEKDAVAQKLKNVYTIFFSETRYEDIYFSHFEEKTRNDFSHKVINFQGVAMTLKELLPTDEFMKQVLTGDVLAKLARNETITIGMELEGLNKSYIPRTFIRSIQIVKDYEIATELQIVTEDELLEQKFVLISSSAGMGKSTALKRLAVMIKRNNPKLWILLVDLNRCTKYLSRLPTEYSCPVDIMKLLNSQETTILQTDLEINLFLMANRVVLLVDAVDEISPDYDNTVFNLLKECRCNKENFAKIFVTTRPHVQNELEKILDTKAWDLEPLSRINQRDFLKKYWTQNLHIQDPDIENKCEYYANVLIDTLSNWIKTGNEFADNPLQTRMIAEVFQERSFDDGLGQWEDCKQFITSKNVEPKLPEKINLVKLYQTFIDKKRNIFIREKGNPNGNVIAEEALKERFRQWYDHHYILAVEQVIELKNQCEAFTCYQRNKSENPEEELLRVGIREKITGRTCFAHRTFAEYFLAECILDELKRGKGNKAFFNMLMWQVFCWDKYALVRTFLDGLLKEQTNPLPRNYLDYNSIAASFLSNRELGYIHALSRGGHANILRFVFNNIRYTKKLSVCYFSWKIRNIAIDVDVKDFIGRTPLQDAAQRGHLDVVEMLVENGANINTRDYGHGSTPLQEAAEGLHFDVVKYLVKKGADVNYKDEYGNTPIIEAATARHVAMVWFFLEHGANPNVTNNQGATVLHPFIRKADFNLVKNLLEKGVNVNAKDARGSTPLHLAVISGNRKIIKLLLEHGADVNATNDVDRLPGCRIGWGELHCDKRLAPSLLAGDHVGGFTALHLAVGFRNERIVKFLVQNGADINARDGCGCTPLIVATHKRLLEIVEILLEEYANQEI